MPTPKLTAEVITAAIDGFEAQKHRIEARIADLRQALIGSSPDGTSATESPRHRRTMSAAARKRIAEAQRKRWATTGKESQSGPAPPRKKRRISAAGKRRIVEATKKRWARYRAKNAAQQKAAPKPAKKGAAG